MKKLFFTIFILGIIAMGISIAMGYRVIPYFHTDTIVTDRDGNQSNTGMTIEFINPWVPENNK